MLPAGGMLSGEPEYVPTARRVVVKPGPGPDDLMHLPINSKDELLRLTAQALHEPETDVVRMVFRYLGSPRAWQLGGERVLGELDSEDLDELAYRAKECLFEPYHDPYRYCGSLGAFEEATLPERDLTNPEVIERCFFQETMPIEFLESLADLVPGGGYQKPPNPYDFVEFQLERTVFGGLPVRRRDTLEMVSKFLQNDVRQAVELLYRNMGSPRGWQLGQEQICHTMDEESLGLLVAGARKLLAEMEPGHRYLLCRGDVESDESEPRRDFESPEIVEKWFFRDTMPMQFIWSLRRLIADRGYRPPRGPHDAVTPGPGPTDFTQLPDPKDDVLKHVSYWIERDVRQAVESAFLGLGLPRAWQLGGEQVLRELSDNSLRLLAEGARKLLAEMGPGHRYLRCRRHQMRHGGPWPEMDLTNPEIIEKTYYGETIPIEFLERIAALA